MKLVSYLDKIQVSDVLRLSKFLMLESIKVLERTNMERTRAREKAHRIHIACKDRGRSEQDVLHRFIAKLKLPKFQIEKVNIQDGSHKAKVVLSSPQSPHIISQSFSSLFKRKSLKPDSQLRLKLDLYKLDAKGMNFFMDYAFECRSRQTAHNIDAELSENVHAMIQMTFEGCRSFSISPMPDVEVI